jgi:ribosomal protein S21
MSVHAAVTPEPFESVDSLLRRFKKASQKANVLHEFRTQQSAVSPGARKRRKRNLAQSRQHAAESRWEKRNATRGR